jgi:hypothetical protein
MNDAVKELYELLLKKNWAVTDQKEVDKVRIVMISTRKPSKIATGIISRGGKKLTGTHNYPTKIFCFNTSSGEASALTVADMREIDHNEIFTTLSNNKKIKNTDTDHMMTGEILL